MGALLALLPSLSLAQWITIATTVGTLVGDVKQLYADAHPALAILLSKLGEGATPHEASQSAMSWIAANADKAIQLQPGAIA